MTTPKSWVRFVPMFVWALFVVYAFSQVSSYGAAKPINLNEMNARPISYREKPMTAEEKTASGVGIGLRVFAAFGVACAVHCIVRLGVARR